MALPPPIETLTPHAGGGWSAMRRLIMVIGPGLVVMLADTDAGSVITAAQSGAQWRYKLLLLQLLIVPVLYMVQELTVRLGLATGQGFGALVRQRFGRVWAGAAVAALVVSCFGALVTELSGLAGVGEMFGVPVPLTVTAALVLIFTMICTGSYRRVEVVAIGLGMFELAFLVVAWNAGPQGPAMLADLRHMPLDNADYLYLLAANLGTSVMPWTVCYQQAAIVDKGLTPEHQSMAKLDTFIGAVLCQVITAAVLVAAAASLDSGTSLDTVGQIGDAFGASLGPQVGRIVFALGLSGGALVATIVVCLTASWTVGEVTGFRRSLEHPVHQAPWFYGAFGLILLAGGVLVASGANLIELPIAVGVVNAVLLPLILGLLFCLARVCLPHASRPRGVYAVLVAAVFVLTAGLGLYSGVVGALG